MVHIQGELIKVDITTNNSTLNFGKQGIPLHVVAASDFTGWLSTQSPQCHHWLDTTGYSGEGLALIPASTGELEAVLFVTTNPSDFFAVGDLPSQLPAQEYLLQTDDEYYAATAFGWAIGCYRFERYKKVAKPLASLSIKNEEIVSQANAYASAVSLCRDLVNTPAADMMPQHLFETMHELGERFNAEVTSITGDKLLEHNYPTIHAVGRASVNAPRLIDLVWGDENAPKVTLVGKGVCFDSGGLDVKPASGMRHMKKDMGGAAHVIGLAQLIMEMNLPIRLRVLVPAVENAISSNALRPGDVVTTRSGKTVEIENTDAEGRLVLCDALSEAENDDPELLIDFATLTGAMRIALGTELPGFFSTSDKVAYGITKAGEQNSDPVWRMPLYQPYLGLFKSDIADMTNCGSVPQGGAITAALYLQQFVKPDTDWVHFDVMAFNTRKLSGRPTGGEAFGIRAVFDYLNERYGE